MCVCLCVLMRASFWMLQQYARQCAMCVCVNACIFLGAPTVRKVVCNVCVCVNACIFLGAPTVRKVVYNVCLLDAWSALFREVSHITKQCMKP